MKFLLWLLRLLGFKKAAAFLEGGTQGIAVQEAQETQEAVEAQTQIVQEEGKSDAALTDTAQKLGLVE